MIKPEFSRLKALETEGGTLLSGFTYLHPNPRLYKYMWRIFWRGSPCEGNEFWDTPPLTSKAAIDLIYELKVLGEPCMVSNFRVPRRGVLMWDLNHPRFKNFKLAPAYDDDSDPPTETGHR